MIKKTVSVLLVVVFLSYCDVWGMRKSVRKHGHATNTLQDRPSKRKECRHALTSGRRRAAAIVEKKRNNKNNYCCDLVTVAAPIFLLSGGILYWLSSDDGGSQENYYSSTPSQLGSTVDPIVAQSSFDVMFGSIKAVAGSVTVVLFGLCSCCVGTKKKEISLRFLIGY